MHALCSLRCFSRPASRIFAAGFSTKVDTGLLKQLREQTGAPMMDCKNALVESGGDLSGAIDFLRKKGAAAAKKKVDRTAAQGLVSLATSEKMGSMIEVNSETDFVARNELFQNLVSRISARYFELCREGQSDFAQLTSAVLPPMNGEPEATVSESVAQLVGSIRENLQLRRAACVQVDQGLVSSYVHTPIPGTTMGRIGVLVGLKSSSTDKEALSQLGLSLAMHVAASRPLYLNIESVPEEHIEREKAVFAEQAQASGKSADLVQKMVTGKLQGFFKETVLLEQIHVLDESKRSVTKILSDASKKAGTPIELSSFACFRLGDVAA